MLLRSLSVRNIRSYNDGEETTLDLPEGIVLFEGDIGSGKSTLLYALEFALFGFSDMKGAHILSEGKKEGKVTLRFESGGEEHTIERRLRARGNDVVQDECYIISEGGRERLSPSDLKERVVAILGFNEPTHPKAESLVYRYAVFTPQEQMKEILVQNTDDRLHVIRRVLGAQSYQVAAENSEIVEKKIRESAYGLRKSSDDLEEKKAGFEEKGRAMGRLESAIPGLRAAEASASKLVRSLEAEWRRTRDDRESLGKSEAKIPLLRQELAGLKAGMDEDATTLHGLEEQLATEVEPAIKRFGSMARPGRTSHELQEVAGKAKERLGRLAESRRNLEAELARTRDLLSKGVCPVCGQRISGDLSERTEHAENELDEAEAESATAAGLLSELAKELEAALSFEEAEKESMRAERDRARLDRELGALRKRIQESSMRSARLRSELEESEQKSRAMREVSELIESLETQLAKARGEEKKAGQDVAKATAELSALGRELESLSTEIKKKEAALQEARRLTSYHGWLTTYFRPSVELIEKQTLALAASRFNEHFQRFFTTLVDDPDMVVRVKEDFSPVFEREGFEQEFAALSGGERTSMALAYRFALNSVVKESLSSRPELLILDEPTDGFSREQVYKMRGLLDELDSQQVILVSHERELESMADHIFRVEKKNGVSKVSEVRA